MESKKFNIVIREKLEKVIEVEANSYGEALQKVENLYYNGEIILNSLDSYDHEIY